MIAPQERATATARRLAVTEPAALDPAACGAAVTRVVVTVVTRFGLKSRRAQVPVTTDGWPAGANLAVGAVIMKVVVAIVALLRSCSDAVAAFGGADRGLVAAVVARLNGACRAATITRAGASVVAPLRAASFAVATDCDTARRWKGAIPAVLDLASLAATVAGRVIIVIADLVAGQQTISADRQAFGGPSAAAPPGFHLARGAAAIAG
jgi:hypothetical protein